MAKFLQRDSFILWNIKSAASYSKNGETYSILKNWNDIDVKSRSEVKSKEKLWKPLLFTILEELNNYFESGEISDEVVYEILAVDAIIDVVLENIPSTVENLKNKTRTNSSLDAPINNWWMSTATEYGYSPTVTNDKPNKFYKRLHTRTIRGIINSSLQNTICSKKLIL